MHLEQLSLSIWFLVSKTNHLFIQAMLHFHAPARCKDATAVSEVFPWLVERKYLQDQSLPYFYFLVIPQPVKVDVRPPVSGVCSSRRSASGCFPPGIVFLPLSRHTWSGLVC